MGLLVYQVSTDQTADVRKRHYINTFTCWTPYYKPYIISRIYDWYQDGLLH